MEAEGEPRALVIDLDGTLADTFPAMQMAFSGAVGRPIAADVLLAMFGPGAGTEAEILEALGAPGPAALEAWYRQYEAAHEKLQPFSGMREILTEARRRGLRTGMLTGKGRRSTEITLRRLKAAPLLEVVVTGDEAPAPKPDPRGLLMVLEQLKVAPARAVYVGDSLADRGAARRAGVRIAAALWDPRATIARSDSRGDFSRRAGGDIGGDWSGDKGGDTSGGAIVDVGEELLPELSLLVPADLLNLLNSWSTKL